MGIQSFFGDLKEKVQWQFNKNKAPPLPPPKAQNLGEELRLMVNSPRFEAAYNTAAPFLFACVGAWPGYWAFRAMDYHVHRSHIPLEMYIRQVINSLKTHFHLYEHICIPQTYYQAKAVQLFIIMAGTYTVFRNHKLLTEQSFATSQVNGYKDI
ncbi:hypothetical protein KR032_008089 [Drosophila birchii]|nr:hypothetical protein KR032_008089 [Drosophila birchii]